jgi:hypothetical protein
MTVASQMTVSLDLLVEVAPDGACLGHIPLLPGLSFRAKSAEELRSIAQSKVAEYADWLWAEKLSDLNTTTSDVVRLVREGRGSYVHVIERERTEGAQPWISGNPAALFQADRIALTDQEVRSHLRLLSHVVSRIRSFTRPLTPAQQAWKPAPDRRSLNETLAHVGNCVWWYCSRLDDFLPEPEERLNEDPLDRIERLLELASQFLLFVPPATRSKVQVPKRFHSSDPHEPWTHTKVCRRQVEHAWEHLLGIKRTVNGLVHTSG